MSFEISGISSTHNMGSPHEMLQVEYDEHGEKIVDETTGMTVVPSVIGE